MSSFKKNGFVNEDSKNNKNGEFKNESNLKNSSVEFTNKILDGFYNKNRDSTVSNINSVYENGIYKEKCSNVNHSTKLNNTNQISDNIKSHFTNQQNSKLNDTKSNSKKLNKNNNNTKSYQQALIETVKFIFKNPVFKLCIIPVFLLSISAAKFGCYVLEIIGDLELHLSSDIKKDYLSTHIFGYMITPCIHYTLIFINHILISCFIQNIVRQSFKSLTLEYLKINYEKYHELGSGQIHSLIERRMVAISEFLNLTVVSIFHDLCYVLTAFCDVKTKVDDRVFWANIIILIIYLASFHFVVKCRTTFRLNYNEAYNLASNRCYNILVNYDVIKAYNNDLYEIEKLDKKLEIIETKGIFFKILTSFAEFLQKNALVIPNGIILYCGLKGIFFNKLSNVQGFLLYNKLFLTVKAKIADISKDVMQVSQYLTDIGDSRVVGCRLDEDDCCGEVICSDGGCDGGVYCNNVNNTVNNSCNTVNNKNVNNSIYNNNDNTPSNTILCNNIPSNIKSTINSFNNKLEFKNFSLKINNRYLIKNANLEIKKGEKVAIIGKNGTGKSSFVNVLLRLRDYEGKFLIDGQNVSTITKSSLRDIISYIPQNPGISEGTVLDNLTYGNPTIPFDKVKEYCFEYGVDRLFNSLQNGYNTQVGEMGKYLSGGQKQRISFMRAVIKNGDIFIFDEPTSNLDSNSEREVLSYVFSKLKYKTSVVILHNMEYLNKFDKILGFSECGIKCYEMYEEYVKDEYLY